MFAAYNVPQMHPHPPTPPENPEATLTILSSTFLSKLLTIAFNADS